MSKKLTFLSFTALFVFLFAGLSESAVRVNRLGDPRTAFYSPDIKTQEDLRQMLQVRRDDIRAILIQVGWRGNVEDLLNALDKGVFDETTISTGTQIPFMAARKRGRPVAMRDVIYEGPEFVAYYVDFESAGTGWRFYAPKICSNFWVEERAIERPAPPPEPEPPPPPEPEPPPPPQVEEPPPPEVPVVEEEGPGLFFVAGFIGKERRTEFENEDLGVLFADCETILGVKAGVLPRIAENMEAELSVGGKFVIADDDDDLDDIDDDDLNDDSDHSIFVDAALQGVFNSGFVGAGVSFWDLTNDDRRTVALLLQFGFGNETIQFTGEARTPFEDLDDIGNNYMIWGGIRIRP